MRGFADFLLDMVEYNRLLSGIKEGASPINITGVSESQKAHLIYSTCMHSRKPGFIITYSALQARKIYEDMRLFAGECVKLFTGKEFIFYEVEAYSTELVQQRLKVLDALHQDPEGTIVVTSLQAVTQVTIPHEVYIKHRKTFEVGMQYDLQQMIEDFMVMGYERVDMIEGRGQFSVRGGIVDFYPLISDYAYRLEFFDDEIDSIRELDVMTQRSVDKVTKVHVSTAGEVLFDKAQAKDITDKMHEIVKHLEEKIAVGKQKEILMSAVGHLKVDMEKIKQAHYFPSIDKYLPLIYDGTPSILEYVSDNAVIFLDEPLKIKEHAETMTFEFNETIRGMMEKGLAIKETSRLMMDYTQFITEITARHLVGLNAFSRSNPDFRPQYNLNIVAKILHSFHGKMEFLYDDLEIWKKKKYRIVILAGTKSRGEELVKLLNDKDFNSIYVDNLEKVTPAGQVVVTQGVLNKGFEYPLIRFVLISDKEIFKQQKKANKAKKRKPANAVKAFTDLHVGDYVVHQGHGIGQYMGIEKLVVEGATKDYLKLKYHGEDFLYVPTNQLDLVQKYIGAEGKSPRLHKMGGAEWTKTKARVKKSVQDLAKGLLKLYAARQTLKGHAFSADMPWQRQFEDAFPYEETGDQLRCIEEVKKDMELSRPMERLLCGDVGYGKTEVAIRAAFKAVMDGKQVAYLVPTTILAQQHYSNFTQRMSNFPVEVEMLSRFRNTAEQKKILKQLKTGEVDVIIGTHRILQKDLNFKNLGLLIVDEEQRFGVTHKEKLKDLQKSIDVLTLTATPIPRTLHMSMIGVRDMSVLEEPPEDRHPVQTYVLEYNDALIQDAIIREVGRGGQVYYLYNRVKGIYKVAQHIKNLVPEARVAVGHGQMNEKELEDVMFKVLNGEIDVLVCTTIIETGLDISNVNTIIIEDADRMGLSQLYQLRGRVGRSNRFAYAYITYRKNKVLQESAEKRLHAIKEFTEFGSGFKIAMRDLEIRGAGNLLGPEQHGHMEAVGYDTYCKLLEQSVRELKGETVEENIETTVDLNANAYIPDSYIGNPNHRVDIYKKIASIQNLQDLYDVEEEIEDRYGDLPAVVRNLTKIAFIKSMASELKICSLQQKGNTVLMQFLSVQNINMRAIFEVIDEYKNQLLFNASDKPYLAYKVTDKYKIGILENVKIVLQKLKELQTS